ncbi:restriction system protein [Evansella vedderi]|uniref:Restriction system protein n=1 Tax=Evansella vedderi TaxID=38282 RepID=A0ABT9ZWL7_9BACI|nr:restriction endonuclease [Evansella vedderi]MDQ0255618.1 restriction system protein [Evansella vedderi]
MFNPFKLFLWWVAFVLVFGTILSFPPVQHQMLRFDAFLTQRNVDTFFADWWMLIPLLIVSIIIITKIIPTIKKKQHFKRANMTVIDQMDGFEFEEYLAYMFTKLGYKAKKTRNTGDYGADVVLKKDGIKTVVQAKRYKNKVGIDAVQQIVGSKSYYKADKAMVVTNSTLTGPAYKLAKVNGVEVWDREKLIYELSKFNTHLPKKKAEVQDNVIQFQR